jgi:hypothetical protein
MMNPAIKAQWLRDLRSGEYPQGTGKLRTSDGKFCCLGVLCEQAVKAGIVILVDLDGTWGYRAVGDGNDVAIGTLPEAVQDWAGLSCNPGVPIGILGTSSLSTLNDGFNDGEVRTEQRNFREIADLIEAHL